ncbi:MAG: hypothetical protein J0I07_20350 [Myxococcales bacterium]|nr:hypothetical protein [Myxococcales bacterium]
MRDDRARAPSSGIGARRRRAIACACALATGSSALVSLAQHGMPPEHGKVRLVWVRGTDTDSCATREELMRSVVTRLGYDPFSEDGSRLVVGSVTHTRGRYVITLRADDSDASSPTRQLESSIDDCSSVGQAAALALALDIEATSLAPSRSTDAAVLESSAPPLEVELDASAKSELRTNAVATPGAPRDAGSIEAGIKAPTAPSRRGASASVGMAGSFGLLPRAAAGVDVAGIVHFDGPLSLSVGMAHFPEVSADDPRFSFGSTLLRAGACLDLFSSGPDRLDGCAHAVVGSTHSVVEELQPVASGPRRFAAPALGLRYSRSFGPLVLSVGGNVLAPFPRYQFDVLGTNRVAFAPSTVAALANVAIGAGF